MQIDIEKRCWIYVGRDLMRQARLVIRIGFGYREDAKPGEIVWRHWWLWSSASLPHLLWQGSQPIGYCAFGRRRIMRVINHD